MIPGACPIAGGSRYRAKAVTYNGSTDYLSRSSALSGLSDGTDGTLSFWMKIPSGDGTSRSLFQIWSTGVGAPKLFADLTGGNLLTLTGRNSGGTTRLTLTTASTLLAGTGWRHIIGSWQSGSGGLYIDGALDVSGGSTGAINYAATTLGIAARPDGTNKFTGDLAEVFFHPSFIDLSVAANLQKFRTAGGKPAAVGSDGSGPLGVQPIVYLTGPASTAGTNKGSGGNYTINGAPTDASTSPSD